MPLLINQQLVDQDSWQRADEAADFSSASVPAPADLLVSWEQWQGAREVLLARGGRLGIQIPNDLDLSELAADLPSLALVAIDFPSFGDGRAFSLARLLRQRYGFSGQVRATGDVTWDRLRFMQRCGFDAMEIAEERFSPEMAKAFTEISVNYQGAADGIAPLYQH